jgi:ribose-phosphate pyrophosphokinase
VAKSKIQELIVTDSIPLRQDQNTDKIRVIGIAKLFSEVLQNLVENKSISSHFIIS